MKQKNRSCKRIISFDITTGEVFKDNSLNECAAKHGVPRQVYIGLSKAVSHQKTYALIMIFRKIT